LSPKTNSMRPVACVVLCLLAAGVMSCFAYVAGVNETMGRAAYVNATFVRLEEQCVRSNDMACIKVYWRMRAGGAAATAKLSSEGFRGNSMEAELAEYTRWEQALPVYDRSKK